MRGVLMKRKPNVKTLGEMFPSIKEQADKMQKLREQALRELKEKEVTEENKKS